MPYLAGKHADLTAMVCVMRDEIAKESGDVGFESFDAAVVFKGGLQYGCQRSAALVKGFCCLCRSDFGFVELVWDRAFLCCGLEPHDPDVMDVGDDGGDGAAFAVGRLCAPCFRGQIF